MLLELVIAAPILVGGGTPFVSTDTADSAMAEKTAAPRPSPLLAVSQHVFSVLLIEQQRSPAMTAAPEGH